MKLGEVIDLSNTKWNKTVTVVGKCHSPSYSIEKIEDHSKGTVTYRGSAKVGRTTSLATERDSLDKIIDIAHDYIEGVSKKDAKKALKLL